MRLVTRCCQTVVGSWQPKRLQTDGASTGLPYIGSTCTRSEPFFTHLQTCTHGTLAAAMTPIRALASSTIPLSIHLYVSCISSPTLTLTLTLTPTLTLTLTPTLTLTSSDGSCHRHTSERRPRACHGAPKTRGGAKPSERRASVCGEWWDSAKWCSARVRYLFLPFESRDGALTRFRKSLPSLVLLHHILRQRGKGRTFTLPPPYGELATPRSELFALSPRERTEAGGSRRE